MEVRGRFRMSWIGSRVNYSSGFGVFFCRDMYFVEVIIPLTLLAGFYSLVNLLFFFCSCFFQQNGCFQFGVTGVICYISFFIFYLTDPKKDCFHIVSQ